jgi:hypothetical protein
MTENQVPDCAQNQVPDCAQDPNCAQVPDWANLAFLSVSKPISHTVNEGWKGAPSRYLVVWGCHSLEFDIPNGSIRKGNTVVEPSTFTRMEEGVFRVYINHKWFTVNDITFVPGGMEVTFQNQCSVSKRTFLFSEMQWNLKW